MRMAETERERADVAERALCDLDEGFHYTPLAYDEDARVIEVVWNYDYGPEYPRQRDDFTDTDKSMRRRALAIERQNEYDRGETKQAQLVTDGGFVEGRFNRGESDQ